MFLTGLVLTLTACGGGSDSSPEVPTDPTPTPVTNSAPTGEVSITGGTMVGNTLSADVSLADANGLGTFSYQWRRLSGGVHNDIDNATSDSYQLTESDIDFTLSVSVSYTDGDGFAESVDSNESEIITATPDSNSAGKPNILLIIADDQGVDASAQYSYSNDLPLTPNLTALANQGLIFDNAWATPACTTTRATIITGQHGINSGVDFVPAVMDSSALTLQKHIKSLDSDYQTAVIGKWHLGGANPDLDHPTDSGADYYAGTITGTIDDYYDWQLTEMGATSQRGDYHTTGITDLAVDWLAEQNSQERPWFLWMAYVAPHSPFHLPPSELHERDDLTGTASDIQNNRRDYYLASIEAMDSEIGRLLASLPDNERENTLIIYIGDNGTPAGVIDTEVFSTAHSKNTLYEGGIRVPMFVSGLTVERQNEREDALINSTDIFATVSQFIGGNNTQINDSYSFYHLFSNGEEALRTYNYSEFTRDNTSGWSVRNQEYKLLSVDSQSQALYQVNNDINEEQDLSGDNALSTVLNELNQEANRVRGIQNTPIDITNAILTNRSGSCTDYIEQYQSTVLDVNNSAVFNGDIKISLVGDKCHFDTNNIPNHDFNDGDESFPHHVAEQDAQLEITASPTHASTTTGLSLALNNAVMLNGVKVDLLAAACFGVGNEKTGCGDLDQPWRFDPMHEANEFRVDSHNAHSQNDGAYHYHGKPNALFDDSDDSAPSPVVGFAADGYPIYGSYFDDGSNIRKALSSYQLISGERPSTTGNPGGTYDGSFRDDYEYIQGSGDLDECNGMTIDGVYGYFITDGFPYVLACFKGTPDPSFNK
ncbi:N-acetylgalactosamine 6-sulfatase [Glaciecola sp. KUL10]|nr:N-acetylgalactosamine 6-sulfatase [Glaciecola sp. KUL10]